MSYETKPGNGALFKNKKKEKANHPDYTGNAVLPDGTEVWLSAWLKEAKDGSKYMSLAIKPKDAKDQPTKAEASKAATPAANNDHPFDDEIPF